MKKRGDLNRKTTAIILKTLVDSGEPLHVREVIKRSGLCNETVVRVLKTLAEKDWLECMQLKNKKYYYLRQNLPIKQAFKLFSLIKINENEEERKEKISDFEKWVTLCAALSNCFATFFQKVDEIRKEEEYQVQIKGVMEKINEVLKPVLEEVDFAISFYKRNKEKIEFLRKEFLSEKIDIYEIDVYNVIKLVSWFMKNESGYLEMRARGLRPFEALEWAHEYKWIKFRKDMKTTPMGEWDVEVRRLHEHPLKVLRDVYGWRLTYKKILGLED